MFTGDGPVTVAIVWVVYSADSIDVGVIFVPRAVSSRNRELSKAEAGECRCGPV